MKDPKSHYLNTKIRSKEFRKETDYPSLYYPKPSPTIEIAMESDHITYILFIISCHHNQTRIKKISNGSVKSIFPSWVSRVFGYEKNHTI